jgi:hypothetical protein
MYELDSEMRTARDEAEKVIRVLIENNYDQNMGDGTYEQLDRRAEELMMKLRAGMPTIAERLEALRVMWCETFLTETPKHAPEAMRAIHRLGIVQAAVERRLLTKIQEAHTDRDSERLLTILAGWGIEVEDAALVATNAHYRGFCALHPTVRVTSQDGLFDAPCGVCEYAMEGDR